MVVADPCGAFPCPLHEYLPSRSALWNHPLPLAAPGEFRVNTGRVAHPIIRCGRQFAPGLLPRHPAERPAIGLWHGFGLGLAISAPRLMSTETRHERHSTTFLAGLAELLGRAGEVIEGLVVIDKALERSERHEEGWCLPELLRTPADRERSSCLRCRGGKLPAGPRLGASAMGSVVGIAGCDDSCPTAPWSSSKLRCACAPRAGV